MPAVLDDVIHPLKKELLTCKGDSKRCKKLKQGRDKNEGCYFRKCAKGRLSLRGHLIKEGFGEGNSPGKNVLGSGNCKFKDPKAGTRMLQEK